MRAIHAGMSLLVYVSACGPTEQSASEVPAGWTHVETRCQFEFDAPPEITETPTQGIDSCVVQFEIDGCTLRGGSGGFADMLTSYGDQPQHHSQVVRVDGEDATLVRYRARETDTDKPFFAGVYIPKGSRDSGLSVDLHAWCTSPQAQERATQVLHTITSTL